MKIPNLGLILYYIIFIVLIPIVLFLKSKLILKYYIPMIVVIAHLLSLVGDEKIFGNLYSLKHTTLTSKISTYVINIIALLGILWQIKDYTLKNMLFTGIFLLVIVFVLSRTVLKHILDYVHTNFDDKYTYNWSLLFFGLVYIIVLLVIQYAMIHISYKFIDERNNINKTQQFVKNFDLANINSFNNKLR